jgi:nicotinamidase-related amidase
MTDKLESFQLDRQQAILVVIDIQERLAPAMKKKVYANVLANVDLLVKGMEVLEIPTVVTEQYPRGLGHTVEALAQACSANVVEKVSFGCSGEPNFMSYLKEQGRTQVIVVGMEAHVCVYQTVLGLIESGYHVHLVRDAICSRNKNDYQAAVESVARVGANVLTTEMALFQLLKEAGTPEFKAISKLVKEK